MISPTVTPLTHFDKSRPSVCITPPVRSAYSLVSFRFVSLLSILFVELLIKSAVGFCIVRQQLPDWRSRAARKCLHFAQPINRIPLFARKWGLSGGAHWRHPTAQLASSTDAAASADGRLEQTEVHTYSNPKGLNAFSHLAHSFDCH